jgi:hypothetical protein
MEYKDFLQKKTLDNLSKQSANSLKQILDNKTIMQAVIESQEVIQYISSIEKPHLNELTQLIKNIIVDIFPVVKRENITLNIDITTSRPAEFKGGKNLYGDTNNDSTFDDDIEFMFQNVDDEIKRRIINGITHGASIRGAFAFHLFDDKLNEIDSSLVEKYGKVLKNAFDVYDSDQAIAMFLSMVSQAGDDSLKGGESQIRIEGPENNPNIIIDVWALNFPMALHEAVKGFYELISLQGFKGLESNVAKRVAGNVDKLENEPEDMRYGKFIYDALNNIIINSNYTNPTIKEFFFAEVYQMDAKEFLPFIENLINDELTPQQKRWVNDTLKDIDDDIKADDYDDLGIDENVHPLLLRKAKLALYEYKKKSNLLEYSEKFINDTIERWKQDNPEVNNNVARQLIKRFDQVKSGLSSKLEVVVLPDDLKKGNRYLNLDFYSFEDLVKLIRSIPEKESSIIKQATKRFIDKFRVPAEAAKSYIKRFLNKKENLKIGATNGIEELGLSSQDVLDYIPQRLRRDNAFLDPRVWDWNDFERLLDGLFPVYAKVKDEDETDNTAETDADKIYNKNGLEIYKADDINKCIKYNPTDEDTKRKTYGWCVSQPGSTMYDNYRFKDNAPTFYIVFDRNKPSTRSKNMGKWDDPWHAYVIQAKNDNTYLITNANNDRDLEVNNWEEISTKSTMDTEGWNRLKGLEDLFKSIPLSAVERGRKMAAGMDLSLDEFKELSIDEKILYVLGQGSKNSISDELLEVLPRFPKIKVEGRSTTLANIAIDSGQEIPYKYLKEYPALAKRYAIFRFRHTDYGNTPIPLVYVQYLDQPAKEKYLETFDSNLTFEYILEFFGEEFTRKYVNEEAKKLEFLPPKAINFIDNNNLKQLYVLYSKLIENWQFSSNTNISREELEKQKFMPEQAVGPNPLNYSQLKSMSSNEINTIISLINKYNKSENYNTLLYALPFLVKDNNKEYFLVPNKAANENDVEKWILVDKNMKILKEYDGDLNYNDIYISHGYYVNDEGQVDRILDLKSISSEE